MNLLHQMISPVPIILLYIPWSNTLTSPLVPSNQSHLQPPTPTPSSEPFPFQQPLLLYSHLQPRELIPRSLIDGYLRSIFPREVFTCIPSNSIGQFIAQWAEEVFEIRPSSSVYFSSPLRCQERFVLKRHELAEGNVGILETWRREI